MEPIISKLQEGVKYPRFERDATKTINDLVEHITKERGVYSSSIEPNPSEHSVWFNTNNNTLYIYDGNTWATVSDKNVSILKEGDSFYPYPVINILNSTTSIEDAYIEENKHYVIIINTNNIKEYLNNIIVDNNSYEEKQFIIIGDDTNTSGTFLVNIYDTYIYYIKLSSTYIEEDNVFYCSSGTLYYTGDVAIGTDGTNISGFYTKERLIYVIEELEGESIKELSLNNIFIGPENESTIIIGKYDFVNDIAILGEELDDIKIYMYNDKLKIGDINDNNINQIGGITWYNANVFCNCKHIDNDIIITHEGSSLDLHIDAITFVVSNNNYLIITPNICSNINELYVNVIKETDDDRASVYIQGKTAGVIKQYINLCGTSLETDATKLQIETFITTTIADIDVEDIRTGAFDLEKCKMLIIDAPYGVFNHTNSLYHLQSVDKLYGTDTELINYLYTEHNVQMNTAINETIDYNDRIDIRYRDKYTNKIIYNNTVYKH